MISVDEPTIAKLLQLYGRDCAATHKSRTRQYTLFHKKLGNYVSYTIKKNMTLKELEYALESHKQTQRGSNVSVDKRIEISRWNPQSQGMVTLNLW